MSFAVSAEQIDTISSKLVRNWFCQSGSSMTANKSCDSYLEKLSFSSRESGICLKSKSIETRVVSRGLSFTFSSST